MTSAGITSPLTDALGSVVAETNAAGTVAANLSYEPYGKSTITGTVSGNSQQYTGRENDGTGLYYYRARYYNPATGRFMSEDPIGFAGGADTYTYANGNPVLLIDPFGLWSWGDPLPDGLANSVVGFGDGVYRALTFGLGNLNEFRNAIGIYGGVDLCSSTYSYGKAWGLRLGAGTLWAAGFNGGSSSMFWAGRGAWSLAFDAGTTIDQTLFGSMLDAMGPAVPRWVWQAASATFAMNAAEGSGAVILYASPTSIWNLELAILTWRGISVL